MDTATRTTTITRLDAEALFDALCRAWNAGDPVGDRCPLRRPTAGSSTRSATSGTAVRRSTTAYVENFKGILAGTTTEVVIDSVRELAPGLADRRRLADVHRAVAADAPDCGGPRGGRDGAAGRGPSVRGAGPAASLTTLSQPRKRTVLPGRRDSSWPMVTPTATHPRSHHGHHDSSRLGDPTVCTRDKHGSSGAVSQQRH